MSLNNNYTIDEVLNLETDEIIYSEDFFEKSLEEIHKTRSQLQEVIQGLREPFYVCLYCKQKVRIRGSIQRDLTRGRRKYHFAHLKDSKECPIKTESGLTKEEIDRLKYNGEKEGQLHINLKNSIAEMLKLNESLIGAVSDVRVEKTIRAVVSKEWKKPDIQFNYINDKIALELQLSTTWLDVITKRQNFYKQNGIFILWVFHKFDIDDEQRRMTDNDVIYTNNQNAFVFDKESIIESQKEKDLVLKCYFKNYKVTFNEIDEIWDQRFVKLSDLTFVKNQMKLFYFDSEEARGKALTKVQEFPGYIKSQTTKSKAGIIFHQESIDNRVKPDYNIVIELSASLSKVNRRISEVEEKLKSNKFVIDKIIESTNNIYRWLLDEERLNVNCSYKICLDIQKQYGSIVRDIYKKKQTIEKEVNELQRKIGNINSLQIINQNSPFLKVVNPNNHKVLFEREITNIGFIDTKENTPLFFEIHWIKDYAEFSRIRYSDGITFVFDFYLRLKEFENNIDILNKQMSNLEQSSNKIKRNIQDNVLDLLKIECKELVDELSPLINKKKQFEDDLKLEENK